MVWYLDTSAFLKLLTTEDESAAMRTWFSSLDSVWFCQLLLTEALRVGSRLGTDAAVIEDALEAVSLVLPNVTTFFVAGQLSLASLRSLDALHLATAIEIGDDLEGMVSYDERLSEAAKAASLNVFVPR